MEKTPYYKVKTNVPYDRIEDYIAEQLAYGFELTHAIQSPPWTVSKDGITEFHCDYTLVFKKERAK